MSFQFPSSDWYAARLQPKTVPNLGIVYGRLQSNHSSSASFHISAWLVALHSVNICSIDSSTLLHTWQRPLSSHVGIFRQYFPHLYALCIIFHRKLQMCSGKALFLIECQIISWVGHLPVSSSTQACVMPKLYVYFTLLHLFQVDSRWSHIIHWTPGELHLDYT